MRRIHYVYRGVPDTDFGPLEMTFERRVLLLDNAADGESPRVRAEAWEDPFAEPLSEGNHIFVEKSGKCAAFDVTDKGAFATFIGDVLAMVEPVLTEPDKVTGVTLRTSGGGVVRSSARSPA